MTEQEYKREWYLKNKERIAEDRKKFREEHKLEISKKKAEWYQKNRERILEKRKKDYSENKDSILGRNAIYRNNNKSKIAETSKVYRERNKEILSEKHAKYRQSKEGRAVYLAYNYKVQDLKHGRGESTITPQWIIENIFTKHCAYCGQTDWRKLGCDRIDNTKPHTEDNVVCSCGKCNVKKH